MAGDGIFRPETYRAENPSLSVAVLCVAAFVVEWFVADAARIWLLCRRQRIALPFRSAVLVHLVSMFAASVTPSNAGVGPTMALALGRLGVPAGRGVGVALQVFVLDAAFFAWAVPLSLGYLVLSGIFAFPVSAGVGALAVAALALGAAVVLTRYPHLVTRIVLAAAQRPPLDRFAPRLRGFAGDYERGMEAFRRMGPLDWLGLQALTASGWFSGFALFWLLLGLYGVDAGFLRTLAVLSGITLGLAPGPHTGRVGVHGGGPGAQRGRWSGRGGRRRGPRLAPGELPRDLLARTSGRLATLPLRQGPER